MDLKQARVLSNTEMKRVLALCGASKNGKRNRIAVLLSHYAGLRVGEIASLKWGQVLAADLSVRSSFYLRADQTKANEAREVHLNTSIQKELNAYRAELGERAKPTMHVIQSQKGGGFSANSLCQLFSRIYKAAGISGASSHSGRRWFITRLAHSGVSPKVIMELAGHKHLTTTQRYIDVTADMKAQAVRLL